MLIAIAVFPGFTALDAVGPYQVFRYLGGADVVVCAQRAGVVPDGSETLRLDVVHTFDEVARPDVVVVPGGQVVHRMIRDGTSLIEWIRDMRGVATYTTSVCTGSLLLGAAGILDGLPATTHWAYYDELAAFGASPTEERVVEAGQIFTAAGVSAGIDLALLLVARLAGDVVAQAIQLGIEYDPKPPFDSGAPSKAPADIRELAQATLYESRARALSHRNP